MVVLLGTVFPLFVQAMNGQSVTIGRPFFDAFTVPIGIALLFFMAIAPALPWRKAAPGRAPPPSGRPGLGRGRRARRLRRRRRPRAHAARSRSGSGPSPPRRRCASSCSPRSPPAVTASALWRGFIGRANGGMIVHIGVVVVAVGLTAATSFAHSAGLTFRQGQVAALRRPPTRASPAGRRPAPRARSPSAARFRVDGAPFAPGIGTLQRQPAGRPDSRSVDSVPRRRRLPEHRRRPAPPDARSTAVTVDVYVQPLVLWLWVGGAIVAIGAVLAAVPGRRRRPTDPVSVAIPELAEPLPLGEEPAGPAPEAAPGPVGAGAPGGRGERPPDRGGRGGARRGARWAAAPGPTSGPGRGTRRRRRALVASSCVGVLALVLVVILATRTVAPGTVTESPLGGRTAPPVAGRNLLTGAPVSLAAERGRYVLVDFFASWCGACQTEAPEIESLLFAHRAARDLVVIGVDSTTDTVGDAAAFLRSTGATYPAISDPGGRIADAYGVASPPQSFLVGPDGKVVGWIPGGIVAAKLDALIGPGR